jgi:hypothetical protein
VEAQEGRWGEVDKSATGLLYFFCGYGNVNRHLGTGFFIHKQIMSAVKRLEFISDRMLYIYIYIRSHFCFAFNVHAPTGIK